MSITVEAVYENGVLRPTQPLPFKEHERVQVTVKSGAGWVEATAGILGWKGDHESLERILSEADEPEHTP